MKKKSLMILGIYLVVCFIGVSFAWMTAGGGQSGNAIVLSYDPDDPNNPRTLSVKSRGIEAEVYVFDETVNDYVVTSNLSESYLASGLVPNNPLNIKIEFINRSEDVQQVDVELANVVCDSISLLENMYFSLTSTDGYSEYSTYIPKASYLQFNEKKVGTGPYTIRLINDLNIPPSISIDEDTEEEVVTPINIYCYFILSRLASSTLENVSLNIGYFRVVL